MKEPQSITEAVYLLQKSIGVALPDMEVSVSINLLPKQETTTETIIDIKVNDPVEVKAEEIMDAKDLKVILNAFMANVGKTEAIKLVKSFTTNGSTKAADIPEAKYNELLKAISGVELAIKGEAA